MMYRYLPGKSKEQAFAIGNEIAETITSMNPAPIKLKFEKVFVIGNISIDSRTHRLTGISPLCPDGEEAIRGI